MPNPFEQLKTGTQLAVRELYAQEVKQDDIIVQVTKREFEGDITVVVFPLSRFARKPPVQTGEEIGNQLKANLPELISGFSVVKGFLNLSIHDFFWTRNLSEVLGKICNGKARELIITT